MAYTKLRAPFECFFLSLSCRKLGHAPAAIVSEAEALRQVVTASFKGSGLVFKLVQNLSGNPRWASLCPGFQSK